MANRPEQIGLIEWNDAPVPVSGDDAAARHASSTGAQAAAVVTGRNSKALLRAFLKHSRLTIAEASVVTLIKEGTICPIWNRFENHGWIVGTNEFHEYQAHGRTVKREWHRLTKRGREVAKECV